MSFPSIKIKIEKQTPPSSPKKVEKTADEIVNEIIPNLFGSPSREQNSENDDKKIVEPIKSSNEILAELFKVFNAAPPKTILDDNLLTKKKHKKKSKKHDNLTDSDVHNKDSSKHKKSKKKKSRKSDDDDDGDSFDHEKLKKDTSKHKKKKKKKSRKIDDNYNSDDSKKQKLTDVKIKKEHDKKESKTRINKHETKDEKTKIDNHSKTSSNDIDFEISDEEPTLSSSKMSSKIVIKSLKDSKIFKEAQTKESNSKKSNHHKHHDKYENKKNRESSEISLSDEETYLKEKKMGFYRESESYYSSNNRDGRSRYHSSHYRDKERRRNWRSRSRSHSRNSRNSRNRSRSRRYRSRSRSHELVIDKKRLLEIARKNAISMFKKGSLPGTQDMTQEVKDKVLLRMRYGGKSVEELTEFCKKLSQGENLNDLSDMSSNGDSDHDKYGNEKAFHHPFVLKDRGPIVMNIKNATPIPPKTADQTKAILMQFPVSSGQQHRLTEGEWIPVSPKRSDSTSLTAIQNKPQIPVIQKNVFQKILPVNEEQQPAFVPTTKSINSSITTSDTTITTTANQPSVDNTATSSVLPNIINTTSSNPSTIIPAIIPLPTIASTSVVATAPVFATAPISFTAPVPVPVPITDTKIPNSVTIIKATESIFPEQPKQNIDVSSVIAKRLNAMRKLQDNPMDPEAIKMMYDSQKTMSAWANSKFTPGQFTGSTGANILSAKELNSGYQAWAKRDQLTSTTPVTGGMGMHLLQKMGWKPGEGLGKTKSGSLQPLLLDVKMDKRGLVATEEDPTIARQKRRKMNSIEQVQKSFEQKHPVSLLDEISTKRKWGPPAYDIVTDDGPSHKKQFVFQVVVNGVMYQPSIPSRTKKEAKALAAKYCLQQLGILN